MSMHPNLRPGFWWWVGLVAYVSVADAFLAKMSRRRRKRGIVDMRYTSMSGVWWDSLQHSVRRWPIVALWLTLTTHLFAPFFPSWVKRVDPINKTAGFVGKYVIGE